MTHLNLGAQTRMIRPKRVMALRRVLGENRFSMLVRTRCGCDWYGEARAIWDTPVVLAFERLLDRHESMCQR